MNRLFMIFPLFVKKTVRIFTDEVLNDDNYTFLLVAHQLNQADDSTIDLINELYDYSVEHGYRFYCLDFLTR